jgi:hypothetical protein
MERFIVANVSKSRSAFFFSARSFGLDYVPKPWISSNTRVLCRTTPCSIKSVETHIRPRSPLIYVYIGHETLPKCRWLPVDTVSYPRTVESSFIAVVLRHINSGDSIILCFFKILFNIIFSSLKSLSAHSCLLRVTGRPIGFWVVPNYSFHAHSLYKG